MSNYPPPYPSPYPSPYAGPPVSSYPSPAATGSPAARRAGVLLFVLGPLLLLLGGCFVGMAALLPALAAQSPQQVAEMRSKIPLPPGLSLELFLGVIGGVVAPPGVALLILAPLVRRGRRWAIITALVIAGLVVLWLAANVISSLFHLDPGGLCFGGFATAAFGLLVAWLIAALRGGPGPVDPYQQYLQQYYHHQQMAQAYAAGGPPAGYGYGAPAAPAVPPPLPPADQA